MTQISKESKPREGQILKRQITARSIFKTLGRWCMEVSSVALSLLIFWLGALGFLMSRQSVDLKFFKPHYEQWFSEAFSGKTANIETYTAKWIQERQSIEIKAHNIAISGDAGAKQDIGEVRGEFVIDPILLTTRLTRLAIHGGALTVARSKDGSLQIGLGTPDTFERVGALWRLGQASQQNESFGEIDTVQVKSAQVYVRDAQDGFALDVQDVDGALHLNEGAIVIDSQGNVVADKTFAPYRFHLNTTADRKHFTAHFDVKNIRPKAIAPKRGRYAVLAYLDAPVALAAEIEVLPKTGIGLLNVRFNADEGTLKTGTTYKPFSRAQFTANYNASAQTVDIENLAVESEAINIKVQGSAWDLGDAASGFLNKPIQFDVELDPVRINPGQKYDGPIHIQAGKARGTIDVAARQLEFSDLMLDFGSFKTQLTAVFKRNEDGALSQLKLDGVSSGSVGKQQLMGLWAHDMVPGTRKWMVNSFMGGAFSNLKIHLNLDEQDIRTKIFANDHFHLRYDVNNADIRYLSKMPWLRGMSGYGILQGNEFEHHVLSGRVDGLTVKKGLVSMPRLSPKGGDLITDFDVMGSAAEMLRVSNFPPFGYADKYGLVPDVFGGSGVLNLRIVRPLLNHYELDDIQYKLQGNFSDVTMPVGYGDYQLNDGSLSFFVDRNWVEIAGPVKIGKWQGDLQWRKPLGAALAPAIYTLTGDVDRDDLDDFGIGLRKHFGGRVALRLQGNGDGLAVKSANIMADFTQAEINIGSLWSKSIGTPGHVNGKLMLGGSTGYRLDDFRAKADGFSMEGSIALADNFRLITLDVSKAYIEGFIDAAVQAKPTKEGVLSLFLTGRYLNIEQWVSKAFRSQSSVVSAPVLMTANLERMSLNENYELKNASALFSHNGNAVQHARLKGSLKDGEFLAEITQDETLSKRVVHVEIPDASHAALALLGLNSIKGGALSIDGVLPQTGELGGLSGTIKLRDFTLVHAPAFAQILSLASLQGLASTLGGSGLKFANLEMNFMLQDGVFKVRDGRASGSALGLTGEGNINVPSKTVDFNGVLVPSYTVNSVLGDIPLLGDIMVGKKGEGMFALNYAVKGPFSATRVSVNPLSALTPGFLRRIFDVKRDKIKDPKLKDLIEKQKQ